MLFSIVLIAGLAAPPLLEPKETLDLWNGKAPGETAELPAEAFQPAKKDQIEVARLGNVSTPQLLVYLPPKEKATGAFCVVAPGGGYNILAIEHEGTDVAKYLNSIGIGAAVLKYRVPRRPMQSPDNLAQLQDVQRALRLVKSRSAMWNADASKVGILGFSAGGHLAAHACVAHADKTYERVDGADELSAKPAYAILIYAGGMLTKEGSLKPEFAGKAAAAPPTFFAVSHDDAGPAAASVEWYLALHKAKVPAELHVCESGGHGYGIRPGSKAANRWPDRAADWLRTRGLAK
jgi:acetyl esterase/lipase